MAKSANKTKPADKVTSKPVVPPVDGNKVAADKPVVEAKEDAAPKALVTVNAKALSVDVGPAVIANMAAIYKDEAKVNELTLQLQSKRYDVLSSLTMACLKAAQNDTTIDLSSTFSGDVKRMNLLNDQLGLALGVRAIVDVTDAAGGKTIKKIGYSKAVSKFFPQPGAKKDDPQTTQKATLRTNYLHQLKKAAQAACAIIDKGMNVKADTKAGTLMISGPAVVEAFGTDNVLLNEKQKVQTDKGEVTLKAKPSFTALKDIGAAQRATTPPKPQGPATPVLDPDLAIQSLCSSLISAIAKLKAAPNDKTRTAFKSVQSAIDKVTKTA